MPNEVTIAVTMADDTAAGRDAVKASWKTTAESLPPLRVTATNPIDEAWRAQVNAEIKATAKEALVVPVNAETEEFRAQVSDTLAGLKAIAAEPIPLGTADADTFRSSVLAAVQETRGEIAATIQPVVIPVEAERVPDLSGSPWPTSDPDQASLRPTARVAGGAFGAGGDPYAQARADIATEPPIEVPVVAANPITDAWRAQVATSIKSISADAVKIPVGADTDAFRAQVLEQIAELSDVRENIPLAVANGPEFQAQVMEQAQVLSRQVKVVIDVDPNTASLGELRANILAAADASQQEVKAQQELATAMQAANADGSAKNVEALAQAEQNAATASEDAAKAQAVVAETMGAASEATDAAAGSARGLGAAMGPLWMVMNVAQIAMFAFGSSSASTATQVQDASQQIIQLGQSAGTAATSMLGGSQSLQKSNAELTTLGTSSTAFAQAYSGNLAGAATYTKNLADRQAELGASTMRLSEIGDLNTRAQIDMGRSSGNTLITIADLTDKVNSNSTAYAELSPAAKSAVDQFNALHDIVPQAQNALEGAQAAAAQTAQTLASLGFVMSSGQQAANNYGLGVQAAAKAIQDATSGARYLEDSTDKASIAAGQGVQQWTQLQAAVASAGQQVESAGHSIVMAEQGVESARHSEQQAVAAVTAAQTGYTNSVYAEGQAQQAVTAARQAAQQQLISLQLQANDAAASADNANLSLFNARQNAAKFGVNSGNAQQIADTTDITGSNAQEVQAAIQLVQAENQVADAQNSSQTAQSSLNTARQQGVDGNPGVVSAEHALTQAQDAVKTAADGVTNAEWAQQQAAIAVGNAQYGVAQASDQLRTAQDALKTAQDAASRSTDASTAAGAQNRQMLENLFTAYENATGSAQVAAQMTETVGEKMGFTHGQINNVVDSLNGLNGTNVNFAITGTPSLNASALVAIGNQLGLSFAQIESTLPTQATHRAQAAGGAGGGLTWVGEQGPELVDLAPGSNVQPHANSMMRVASGDVLPPGKAAGGPVGAADVLGQNLPITAQWGALDVVGQALHALGGPPVQLPAAGNVDWGAFGGMPGSVPASGSGLSGNRAANEALMQQIFASQFGWTGPEWAATQYLMMRESGFNNTAQNPTSTAYGQFQFLDSTWKSYGIPKTSDPGLQDIAGGRYISARYHDPLGAAAHEKAFNWYRGGGPTGGWVGINDGGGEAVKLPNGSTVMPAANSQPQPVQASPQVLELRVGPGADSAAATFVMHLVRSGAIQLVTVANGQTARVKVG